MIPTDAIPGSARDVSIAFRSRCVPRGAVRQPFTGRPLQGAAMAHGGEVARQGLLSMSSDRLRPTFCDRAPTHHGGLPVLVLGSALTSPVAIL